MQSFMPTRFFVFKMQAIKSGFAGPKSFGAFEKRAPGARFSKVPKSFRTRKAITKISNLKFTELFFAHIFNMNKVVLHAKFYAYTLLCFHGYRQLKMASQARKIFGAFEKRAPRRSRKRFGSAKPFSIVRILKTKKCMGMKLCMKGKFVRIKNM